MEQLARTGIARTHEPARGRGDVHVEFCLDEAAGDVEIANETNAVGEWRWASVLRDGAGYRAIVISPEERALTPRIAVGVDFSLCCTLDQAVDPISADGLTAQIIFEDDDTPGTYTSLLQMHLLRGHDNHRALTYDLSALAGRTGRFGVACGPGPQGDPAGDWLAVANLIVGRSDRLGVLRARSHRAWRVKNEMAFFSDIYEDVFFQARKVIGGSSRAARGTSSADDDVDSRLAWAADLTLEDVLALPTSQVQPGDDPYHFAHRVLGTLISLPPPDFPERLRCLSSRGRPLEVLSLCSGEAVIEHGILRAAGVPARLTLYDLNETLIARAQDRIAAEFSVDAILGDVNAIALQQFDRNFDVVLCVAGLHHVVELEHVLRTARELLRRDGEFWLVGEAIGRDGNRLWPDARAAADAAFAMLPDRYRLNCHTGAVDAVLPHTDFAASTFEGIRSSEIELLTLAQFEPVHLYRRNCFLWRMMEMTYSANYDLSREIDRLQILQLVVAEYNFWRNGGRPVESFSVYRPR